MITRSLLLKLSFFAAVTTLAACGFARVNEYFLPFQPMGFDFGVERTFGPHVVEGLYERGDRVVTRSANNYVVTYIYQPSGGFNFQRESYQRSR